MLKRKEDTDVTDDGSWFCTRCTERCAPTRPVIHLRTSLRIHKVLLHPGTSTLCLTVLISEYHCGVLLLGYGPSCSGRRFYVHTCNNCRSSTRTLCSPVRHVALSLNINIHLPQVSCIGSRESVPEMDVRFYWNFHHCVHNSANNDSLEGSCFFPLARIQSAMDVCYINLSPC